MKKLQMLVVILLGSMGLVGCENMSHQDAGVLAGGLAGGILGSTIGGGSGKAIAVATGAIAGAVIGSAVGNHMDREDEARMQMALEQNPVGRPAYWRNERNGNSYRVVPVRNVAWRGNPNCREYRTVAVIEGRHQIIYGTACRRPNGMWRAVR